MIDASNELKMKKVIDAGKELKIAAEQPRRKAAKLGYPTSSSKKRRCSAIQPFVPQSKTQRLTSFFERKSGPADVVEQDAATGTPDDAKNLAVRQKEMIDLYLELKMYRIMSRRYPNTLDIEKLIKQC